MERVGTLPRAHAAELAFHIAPLSPQRLPSREGPESPGSARLIVFTGSEVAAAAVLIYSLNKH